MSIHQEPDLLSTHRRIQASAKRLEKKMLFLVFVIS